MATCNADSVDLGTGTYSWNLPPPPNNVVILGVVNGAPQPGSPDIQNQDPPVGTATEASHRAPLGSPGTPYTVTVQAFPATNGIPIGTGVEISVQCNTLGAGAGTATFSPVAAPPRPARPFAYIANATGNSVSVIDTASNAVVGAPIAVGDLPLSLGQFIGSLHTFDYGPVVMPLARKLSLNVVSVGPGGAVEINGVDTAPLSAAFNWDWGDGSSNPGIVASPVTWFILFNEIGKNTTLSTPLAFPYGGNTDGNASEIYSETLGNIFSYAAGYELMNNAAAWGLGNDVARDIGNSLLGGAANLRQQYEAYVAAGAPFSSWNPYDGSPDPTLGTVAALACKFIAHAEARGGGHRVPAKRFMRCLQTFDAPMLASYDPQHNAQAAAIENYLRAVTP